MQVLLGVKGKVVMDDALLKYEEGFARGREDSEDDSGCDGHLSDDELQGPRLERRTTATACPCRCPRCSGCCGGGLFVVCFGHGGDRQPRELVALRTLREARGIGREGGTLVRGGEGGATNRACRRAQIGLESSQGSEDG